MSEEEQLVDSLFDELRTNEPELVTTVIRRWLEENKHTPSAAALTADFQRVASADGGSSSETLLSADPPEESAKQSPPPAEALPVPGTSTRPGRLYDVETVDPTQVPEQLLLKPDPVFHGDRDERKRERASVEEFPLMVHFDALTSGLESETHFRVEEKQIIAGRYVVIQYLGSGTFCHTVQCEDLKGSGAHRFVCVKVSKNTKDIFDQNLWEVKLLKLLGNRVDAKQKALLPKLLNVFYFRETLFIVYELLRDNLYHIYKYIEECRLPKYFTLERLRVVARVCLQTLECLHAHEVIHCDLKPENILIVSLTSCKVKVIDYGNAYLHHDQRCSYVQSRAYRAPEVVLGLPYTPKVDLWSLGCILMELYTGKLLFDNRSIQALLASHISLLGPIPSRLLKEGQLSQHYFTSASDQTLVGKHDGRLCRLKPRQTSLTQLLSTNGCDDTQFASFIGTLMTIDPEKRASASQALQHPWLQQSTGPCAPYRLDKEQSCGEAGIRLLSKYKSLENVESAKRDPAKPWMGVIMDGEGAASDEEAPGPATPTSFREQCYLDRERLEKKRSRKSGASRWVNGSELPNIDHMVISPATPASGGETKKGRPGTSEAGGAARS